MLNPSHFSPAPGSHRWWTVVRLCAVAIIAVWTSVDTWGLSVVGMTTNGRSNPLGIGRDDVSLAWSIESATRGTVQTAYQVRVGTTSGRSDVWDSGRIVSERQVDIPLPPHPWLASATRYFWQVRVWDAEGVASDWSAPAWFETGLFPEDWRNATWIVSAAKPAGVDAANGVASHPLFRREINVTKPVKSARLYASARGVYQVWLNGEKVGDEFLAPGWTDYFRRIQTQTYDVTSQLHSGANVIGAAMGDGWYCGTVGLNWHHVYGDGPAFIAKLRLTYVDGSVEEVVTNASWQSAEGPFVQADLQDGESYDARLEQPGWDRPGFDTSKWTPAGTPWNEINNLIPQPDDPVRMTGLLTANARTEPTPGQYVYDLGQNLVGVARVRLPVKRGQTIRLRYAEELYRLGERRGQPYTDNLRTAKATDTYTSATDGIVTYQPTFTQHGFRYIEITGVDTPPDAGDVQAVVLGSDLPNTGDLRLPNPMLDQLVRNIRWGQRGNFLSIPTDTPARNERLGWTGDIAVFAPTACRYQDTRAFLGKWLDDVRDAQAVDGNIPAVVPEPRDYFNMTGVGWSDAFIAIPFAVWRATGDTRIVRRNWDWICRYYRFVNDSATHDGNLLEEGRSSWFSGDWLNLEGVDRLAEHRVIATAYFAQDTRMMAEMAAAIGDAAHASEWSALVPKIRAAFTAAYRHPDGTIEMGTQTVYAMTLGMDLISDPGQRTETAGKFVEKLAADNFHLKTGFLGTPWLLPALSRIGRNDVAMRLLLNEDYPSWGFEIRMGATTMWERWNSIRADGEFGPVDMNSFNHYAYGAVGDWMYQHLGGIQIVEPGYRKFRVAPLVAATELPQAHCRLKTPCGEISCEWARAEHEFTVAVNVPANTSAEIVLPVERMESVRESGKPLSKAPGLTHAVIRNGELTVTAGSGHYAFVVHR